MEAVNLRKVKDDDFDFIWRLYSESVRPLIESKMKGSWEEEEQKKQFKDIYSEADTKIILKDEEPVGWIDYRLNGNNLNLVNGYIIPNRRGNGIMSSVLQNLLGSDMTIQASTIKGNSYNSFLDKFGFQTINSDEVIETRQLKK